MELSARKGFSNSLEMFKLAHCLRANSKLRYKQKLKLLCIGLDILENERFKDSLVKLTVFTALSITVWKMLTSDAYCRPLEHILAVTFVGLCYSWSLFYHCFKQDSVMTCKSSLYFFCRNMLQKQARQRHICLIKLYCFKEFSQFQTWNKFIIHKGCSAWNFPWVVLWDNAY